MYMMNDEKYDPKLINLRYNKFSQISSLKQFFLKQMITLQVIYSFIISIVWNWTWNQNGWNGIIELPAKKKAISPMNMRFFLGNLKFFRIIPNVQSQILNVFEYVSFFFLVSLETLVLLESKNIQTKLKI